MCMRKLKNLLTGALLCMTVGTMAQTPTATTALTVKNAKVVPGYTAYAVINFTVPETIGGWQMVLSLPEGIHLDTGAGTIQVGITEQKPVIQFKDDQSNATVLLSNLYPSHRVIGDIAEVDGTGYSAGDLLLLCIPTSKEAALSAKTGELVTLKLRSDAAFTSGTATALTRQVTVKSFTAVDPKGTAAGQYSITAPVTIDVTELKGDANGDGLVTFADIRRVKNLIMEGSADVAGDANGDGKLTLADCRRIKVEINMYE